LNKCLESIRDGNLKAKIPINSSVPREFSDVYNTLNEMTSRIQELKIESPEGIDASTVSYYSWGKWELPNNYLQYVMAPSPSNLWEEMDEFNMAAAPSKALGFVFDTTPVEGEITAVQNVITQYDPGLGSGTLEPSKLEEFQQALLDNGVQKIIDEAQRQLDEFISNKQ